VIGVEALVFLAIVIGAVVLIRTWLTGVNQRKLERLKQRGEALRLASAALRSVELDVVRQALVSTRGAIPHELKEQLELHEAELSLDRNL
jgi:hypothetical protein